MSPAVKASRHYTGPGIGEATGWNCPSCGAENSGPLEQGCPACGAGRPGSRVEPPALWPKVPASPAPPTPPPPRGEARGDEAAWVAAHTDATLHEAYLAGYAHGMRDALQQQGAAQRIVAPAPSGADKFTPSGANQFTRTLVAALTLFRDQVLADRPEEVTTGEWMSAEDVDEFLTQIAHNTRREVAHA